MIENYRKSSRVYADQILMETQADDKGYFIFEGDNLSEQNNMYRIHTDDCNDNAARGSHFFRDCSSSRSVLFIAKKGDTILFPLLQNKQAFCDIASNNAASGLLLAIDGLKEEMVLDFIGHNSDASVSLNLKKWFQRLQEYSEGVHEPIVELYVYDFLSDRKNETYSYFLKDLKKNEYYLALENRLIATYPNRNFTLQYIQERNAEASIQTPTLTVSKASQLSYFWYAGGLFLMCLTGYYGLQLKKRKVEKKALQHLTPQELTILSAIKKDKTNKEIATELFISLSTVKTHINNIYKKLKVNARADVKNMF
jgi:DNA-binding CsgD family transcriptional regulator